MRKTTLELTVVDYARRPLPPEVVAEIVRRAGSVAAVLNTRHALAKERGWASTPPGADEFARAVAAEPNLLRRPILVLADRVIVGHDRDAYAALA